MSLDPLLLDVLACPVDKGPLLWFEDEDVLYNPRLQQELRRGRRRARAAGRRGGRRRRRRARAADGQGREGRGAGHRTRPRGERAGRTSTRSGCGRRRPACPSSSSRRSTAPRDAFDGLGCRRTRAAVRSVAAFGAGHGGTACEAAGRRCTAGRLAVPFWARPRRRTSRPSSDAHTLVFAVSCSGDTEETLAAAAEAVGRGARVVAVGGDAGRRAGRAWPTAPAPWCPAVGRLPRAGAARRRTAGPRRAGRGHRAAARRRCPASASCPTARRPSTRPPRQRWRAGATLCWRRAAPPRSWPAASGAPSRSSTARPAWPPWRRAGGRPRST